jgi:plastocyanin
VLATIPAVRRTRFTRRAALPVLAVLAACGGSSGSGVDLRGEHFRDERNRGHVTVAAVDNDFVPPYVTVRSGTTVTFVNNGRNVHDVIPVDDTFRAIEPKHFARHDKATVTFNEPGDYPYFCSLHGTATKGMRGAIRVVG